MNNVFKIDNYRLVCKKKSLSKIYKSICNKIPDSIFVILGQSFFEDAVKSQIIDVYCIENKKKIASIITVINYSNYKKISYLILKHILKNPHKLLIHFGFLLNSLSKNEKVDFDKSYLHLLHFIIYKKFFINISLQKKDKIINSFIKLILKNYNAKNIFLCFNLKNKTAHKYYRRNKYKLFLKKNNFLFYKRKFI
jgi:hypothetical protein|tara:strand:- start:1487 stop:2071 length:585 start_codon:yes stop_codon:yes gene_type:complete